ncbi:MAG: NfeD family protein [Oscillospiraceae bacterium]|nr:NfeD family protein [Oscillospiraceae bacterium]
MEYGLIIFWAAALVFFLVLEAVTFQLVSVWLGLGALVSLLLAIFEVPFWVQLLVFVAVSAVALWATRPLVKKFLSNKVATNSELDIGKVAIVTETINNSLSKGRVKLNGTYWAARSLEGDIIEEGSTVTVVEVDGSKLIVKN